MILDRKTFAEDYEDEQVDVLPMRGDGMQDMSNLLMTCSDHLFSRRVALHSGQ